MFQTAIYSNCKKLNSMKNNLKNCEHKDDLIEEIMTAKCNSERK